jgi:putative ABC transport system permease protein
VVELGFVTGVVSARVVPVAMATTLVGLVWIVPYYLPLLLRCLRPVLQATGAVGTMAFHALDRRRVRTALTVGVLFIAIVVGIGMGNSILGSVRDLEDWYDRTIVADWFVRAVLPDSSTMSSAQVPEGLEGEVAAVPGVRYVGRVRFLPSRVGTRPVLVIAHTFPHDRPLALDVAEGEPAEILRRLHAGEVVIGTGLARSMGLAPGDEVEIGGREGPRRFRVAGLATEYTVGGSAVYVEWEHAKEALRFEGVDALLVHAEDGREAEVGTGLRALCEERGCLLQSNADLHAAVGGMVEGVTGFLWVILLLVFLVASLGVANTTSMSVLEQTREIGILRAVGLRRREVRGLVLREALGLGLMSLPPGLVGGLVLAVLFNVATYPLTGQPVALRIEPSVVLASLAFALGTAVLAALPAARRASRIPPVQALQYE